VVKGRVKRGGVEEGAGIEEKVTDKSKWSDRRRVKAVRKTVELKMIRRPESESSV
jgi:hypothetical protein